MRGYSTRCKLTARFTVALRLFGAENYFVSLAELVVETLRYVNCWQQQLLVVRSYVLDVESILRVKFHNNNHSTFSLQPPA